LSDETPKAFTTSSPGLRAAARYPGVIKAKIGATLKGLRKIHDPTDSYIRELFQSSLGYALRVSQGVALGWNLRTPLAFTQIIRRFVKYECPKMHLRAAVNSFCLRLLTRNISWIPSAKRV
jgi:hypothetical protein